jgi:hypothetical protein
VALLPFIGNDFLRSTTELWVVTALVALHHSLHEIASRHATAPYRPKAADTGQGLVPRFSGLILPAFDVSVN